KALELGVDGVEIDVFRCKSGEIVVMHDDTVDRTTNGNGYVENLTLEELKTLRIDEEYQLPTLIEVMDLLDAQHSINIELKGKNTAKGTNDIIQNYIKNKGWEEDQFLISSFDWDELKDFYELNKNIPMGILTEDDPLNAIDIA